mmetsp:Transcript_1474/g.4396  ORF Transcript_1474/g.4396 Transcript_1474/m.4396 type:complete len:312 (+) Transcript_1474:264-1199(+)
MRSCSRQAWPSTCTTVSSQQQRVCTGPRCAVWRAGLRCTWARSSCSGRGRSGTWFVLSLPMPRNDCSARTRSASALASPSPTRWPRGCLPASARSCSRRRRHYGTRTARASLRRNRRRVAKAQRRVSGPGVARRARRQRPRACFTARCGACEPESVGRSCWHGCARSALGGRRARRRRRRRAPAAAPLWTSMMSTRRRRRRVHPPPPPSPSTRALLLPPVRQRGTRTLTAMQRSRFWPRCCSWAPRVSRTRGELSTAAWMPSVRFSSATTATSRHGASVWSTQERPLCVPPGACGRRTWSLLLAACSRRGS